jgi:hypothetical protein
MLLFFNCLSMTNFSEKTFGAKLLKAQHLLDLLQGFNGYAPPSPEMTTTAFSGLLDEIADANDGETNSEDIYLQAVQARQHAFRLDDDSLVKLLSPIRASVEAQYKKDSDQYERVIRVVHSIREHGSLAKKKPGNSQDNQGGENVSSEQAISQSEQSYGSLHRHFADLVITLANFSDYNPSNTKLQPATLQLFVNKLQTLHDNVIAKGNSLSSQRNARRNLYGTLSERVQSIKAYVKAQYGLASAEYEAVKGLEI